MKELSHSEFMNSVYMKKIKEICPKVPTDEDIRELFDDKKTLFYLWGLCGQDVRDVDFRNLSEKSFDLISFSSSTKFDEDKLPSYFKPKTLIQSSIKRKINKIDLDDDNVKIAIIDNPCSLYGHENFENCNIELIDRSNAEDESHFHMQGVLSNICGLTGISKNAKILAYTRDFSLRAKSYIDCLNDVLKRIENGEKIQAVSISNMVILKEEDLPFEEEYNEIVDKLKNNKYYRCEVIDSPRFHKNNFTVAHCPITEDIDNIDSYVSTFNKFDCNAFMATKVIPDFARSKGWWLQSKGGASWAIPISAYLYSLSRTIKKNLTFEDFAKVCDWSADVNKNNARIVNYKKLLEAIKKLD